MRSHHLRSFAAPGALLLIGVLCSCSAKPRLEALPAQAVFINKTASGTLAGELRLGQETSDGFKIELTCFGGTAAANMGSATGRVSFVDGAGNFVPDEADGKCEMQLRLLTFDRIEVRQTGGPLDCGLGNGVVCDGIYKRKK